MMLGRILIALGKVVIVGLVFATAIDCCSNRRHAERLEADRRKVASCERRCAPNLSELIDDKCWCDRSLEPAPVENDQ